MDHDPDPELSVTIAVLTYRRPHHLVELLPQLVDQGDEVVALSPRHVEVEVVVVDNDPDGGARATVEQVAALAVGRTTVRYAHEPRPGIAAGRNRALDESSGRDVLVFIDDDERPQPRWLHSLLETFVARPGAAVVGAVVAQYEGELDPWIAAGGFFVRRRLPTGTLVTVAAAGNLLLDRRFLASTGLRFDEVKALAGGEDTLFTRRITAHGGLMVWCDEAVIIDLVPAERMTRSWVLRRSMSSGNAWAATGLGAATGPRARGKARVRFVGQGLARMAGGSARWSVGVVSGSLEHQARGLKTAARGTGIVLGSVGYRYQEYRRAA